MADRIPLVLDSSAQMQQLQSVDDLAIPLRSRVEVLETQLKTLIAILHLEGLDLPDELTEDIDI